MTNLISTRMNTELYEKEKLALKYPYSHYSYSETLVNISSFSRLLLDQSNPWLKGRGILVGGVGTVVCCGQALPSPEVDVDSSGGALLPQKVHNYHHGGAAGIRLPASQGSFAYSLTSQFLHLQLLCLLELLFSPSSLISSVQFSRSVASNSATPRITARQASLSITNSRSSLRLTSIESVMSSRHLTL